MISICLPASKNDTKFTDLGLTLGQKTSIYPKIHNLTISFLDEIRIFGESFLTKFTFSKYHFFTKITILKSHFSQNFKASFFTKFIILKPRFSQKFTISTPCFFSKFTLFKHQIQGRFFCFLPQCGLWITIDYFMVLFSKK